MKSNYKGIYSNNKSCTNNIVCLLSIARWMRVKVLDLPGYTFEYILVVLKTSSIAVATLGCTLLYCEPIAHFAILGPFL